MNYAITHTTKYNYSDAVPVCHNIVHLQPRTVATQSCESFELLVKPKPSDRRTQVDAFGNPATYFSIEQVHTGLTVTAKSRVFKTSEPLDPPSDSWASIAEMLKGYSATSLLDAYEYSFPTARTQSFPALREYTRKSFTVGRSLFDATRELTARIDADFEYDPRATTVSTPITEVFALRRGVCQDFAHLQLACLRSMGLAARYVSGYLRTYPPPGKERLVGVDASHAWVSVYCGDAGWIDFDPTNNMIPTTDHITLAWGRDYNDVCPIRGVILGGGTHRMSVSVDVDPLE